MVIRRETLDDRPTVDAVTSAAFGQPGSAHPPSETVLLQALRRDPGWIPTPSLVAVRDHRVIGHVVCTRGWVGELAALGLGPISDRLFYARFGFVDAARLGVAAPDPGWGSHFQVRTLTDCPASITDRFRYAAPFADL
jgi:putative acetyltransferase